MLSAGFGQSKYEFYWEPQFSDANASDEHWAAAFTRFGGKVIVTGDKGIAKRPHQILAFHQIGLIGFFFRGKWSETDMATKCASLVHWWHTIDGMLIDAKPGDFWWIPAGLRGELKKIEVPHHVGKGRAKKSESK